MDVFLLAGGLGKRLREVSGELPKPLIEINGCRLIERILLNINGYENITRIFILAGYKYHLFKDLYHGCSLGKQKIQVISEKTVMGTGGAVVNAILSVDPQSGFILNADTITKTDLMAIHLEANKHAVDGAVACCKIPYSSDYGNVIYTEEATLKRFSLSNGDSGSTMIAYNGVMNFQASFVRKLIDHPRLINRLFDAEPLSLERDILEDKSFKFLVNISEKNEFNDVGTPLRYESAIRKFKVSKFKLS